jgi:hypothetical protein
MDLNTEKLPTGETVEDKKQRKQFIVDFYGQCCCKYDKTDLQQIVKRLYKCAFSVFAGDSGTRLAYL